MPTRHERILSLWGVKSFCGRIVSHAAGIEESLMADPQSPDSGSVFCTSCGYKLADDDRFCPECGATRPVAPPTPPAAAGADVPPPPPPFPPAGIGGTSQLPPSPPAGFPAAPFPAGVPASPFAAGISMSMAPISAEPGELLFDVEYPDHLSRLLIFVKWLLVIPHFLVLGLLNIVVTYILWPLSWIIILIMGRYPLSMWNFTLGFLRWTANVNAYAFLQRDEYPPFSMDPRQYPVQLEMEYPLRLSRLLIFVKWLLVLPSAFIWAFVAIAGLFVVLIAWFAILFTGRYPQGMFNFITGMNRWYFRIQAYVLLLTDKYPGFSLD
jgi:hypothetical protein